MLSKLEQINWARVWRRLIWTLFFTAFLALVVFMSKDMADNQPVIFGMVILAAVVTAVAFVYSDQSKEAFLIGIFGLCAHLFLTMSYWSSTIEDINVQATRERIGAEARDIVKKKQAERYAESASAKSAAQIQAEIKAAEQHERWGSTKGCTDATIPESREYCQGYYLMKAELAGALTAEDLESTVWKSGTTIETNAIPRNLAKGALFIASLTGMSVESATNLLVIILVLFEQAGLAGSLRVGFAPEKRRQIAPAIIPRKPYTPSLTLPVKPETRAVTAAPEPPTTTPAPDDGGTPVAEPETKPDDTVQPENNVVTLYEPPVKKRDEKRRKKEIIDRQNRALIKAYVDDRLDTAAPSAQISLTAKAGHASGGTAGDAIYTDFRKWCRQNEYQAVGRSHFGRFIGEFVDRARNSKGVVYGAVIRATVAKRKAA
jgi:ribosomal protein L19E